MASGKRSDDRNPDPLDHPPFSLPFRSIEPGDDRCTVRAQDVAMSAPERVPIQIDGDQTGVLPLRLASTTDRIRVLCP